MADDVDAAQARQEILNRTALEYHRRRPAEQPVLVDGIVCCRDCGEPIPEDRLRRVDAVRCVFCQEVHERCTGKIL